MADAAMQQTKVPFNWNHVDTTYGLSGRGESAEGHRCKLEFFKDGARFTMTDETMEQEFSGIFCGSEGVDYCVCFVIDTINGEKADLETVGLFRKNAIFMETVTIRADKLDLGVAPPTSFSDVDSSVYQRVQYTIAPSFCRLRFEGDCKKPDTGHVWGTYKGEVKILQGQLELAMNCKPYKPVVRVVWTPNGDEAAYDQEVIFTIHEKKDWTDVECADMQFKGTTGIGDLGGKEWSMENKFGNVVTWKMEEMDTMVATFPGGFEMRMSEFFMAVRLERDLGRVEAERPA